MSIRLNFKCPSCGVEFTASSYEGGMYKKCANCSNLNLIPDKTSFVSLHKKIHIMHKMKHLIRDLSKNLLIASCAVPIFLGLGYLLLKGSILFFDGGGYDSSSTYGSDVPSNIISVKDSSSDPTIGLISVPKGKNGYLYVPGKKSYEVTYEENGILKTKTMSSDPTK